MANVQLLYPMAALVLLSFGIAMVMLRRRFAAARNRQVDVNDFKVYRFGEDAPEKMLAAGRNFNNLFETPVLLYAVCVSAMTLNLTDLPLVIMAWTYVLTRVVHSYVHVTHNTVMIRMRVFALSCALLLAMWVWVVLRASTL